ncbi:MAG: FISUMP domain-containing protein [Bacteroidota bacterium]|nr:FISUMP domain-containing protein [Bacteroidota bacterium]
MIKQSLTRLMSLLIIILISSCTKENTKPKASFTFDPGTGNDETTFMFDASGSSDMEDQGDELMVMWNWEGDEYFDTQYAVRKTADHKYAPGDYMVTLVVKDSRGLTDTARIPLQVASSNLPPEIPENPKPAHNEENTRIKLSIGWDCIDPDGDMMLYTVFFGTTNPPEQIYTNYAQNGFDRDNLEYKTTYYWKVIAKDVKGNTTEGPVWQFSTLNLTFGSLTDTRDGQNYTTIEIGNQWWMAENLNYVSNSSYCYNDDPAFCDKYGRLYTWESALSACPDEWHLPTKEEFEEMVDHLGGTEGAGGMLKDYESNYWREPNSGASNISGFGALPAGRRYDHGLSTGSGYYAQFYSSTEYQTNEAYNLTLGYDYNTAFLYNYKKKYAISVRCIKDY